MATVIISMSCCELDNLAKQKIEGQMVKEALFGNETAAA